jgi:hypothetical protein
MCYTTMCAKTFLSEPLSVNSYKLSVLPAILARVTVPVDDLIGTRLPITTDKRRLLLEFRRSRGKVVHRTSNLEGAFLF